MNTLDPTLAEKLSKEHREVLQATGTYREIAETLRIPIGTVRSRLNRARKAVKSMQAEGAQ